jgi:hypothetical protein
MSDVAEKTKFEKIKDFVKYLRYSRTGKITLWYLLFIFLVNGGVVIFDAIFAHKFAMWNLISMIVFGFGYPYFFTYRLMYRKQVVNGAKAAMTGDRYLNEWGEPDKHAFEKAIEENRQACTKLMATINSLSPQAIASLAKKVSSSKKRTKK